MRCSAQRCTADPGSSLSHRNLDPGSAPHRYALRCARGTRQRRPIHHRKSRISPSAAMTTAMVQVA